MRPSAELYMLLQNQCKENGEVSYFVLQERKGQLYLSAFISTFSKDKKRIGPPKMCLLCDIETGKIIKSYYLNPKFIQGIPVRDSSTLYAHDTEYKESCRKLDEIRETYLSARDITSVREAYAGYFHQMEKCIPDGLRNFYRSLSMATDPVPTETSNGQNTGREPQHGTQEGQEPPAGPESGAPDSVAEQPAALGKQEETEATVEAEALSKSWDPGSSVPDTAGTAPEGTAENAGAAGPEKADGSGEGQKAVETGVADKGIEKPEKEPEKTAGQVKGPSEAEESGQPEPGSKPETAPAGTAITEKSAPKATGPDTAKTGMDWMPEINLATMPQPMYSILLRIAQRIQVLEEPQDTMLHYSYPVFCFQKDRQTEAEPWLELLVRLHNRTIPTGHFKTPKRPTIYMTCSRGKNGQCLFGKCPYYAALYIRMLSDRAPEELKRQRGEYKKNRRKIDRRQSPAVFRNMAVEFDPDRKKLMRGQFLWDTGTIFLSVIGHGTVLVEHIDNSQKQEWKVARDEIPEKQLHPVRQPLQKVDGSGLPEELFYAILAGYYEQNGFPAPAKKTHQEEGSRESEKDQDKPENPEDMTLLLDQHTRNCLEAAGSQTFYGTFIDSGNAEDNRKAYHAIAGLLKDKGCKSVFDIDSSSVQIPDQPDPSILYVVHDKCTRIPFRENAKILRSIPGPDIRMLRNTRSWDPCMECMILLRINTKALYQEVSRRLPETLKQLCTEERYPDFKAWMLEEREWPDLENEQQQAAFIAWCCMARNRLIFDGYAAAAKKEEGKKHGET